MKAIVTNNKPMPPKHHTKKVKEWLNDNYEGLVVKIEDTPKPKIVIQKSANSWMVVTSVYFVTKIKPNVYSVDDTDMTITLVQIKE